VRVLNFTHRCGCKFSPDSIFSWVRFFCPPCHTYPKPYPFRPSAGPAARPIGGRPRPVEPVYAQRRPSAPVLRPHRADTDTTTSSLPHLAAEFRKLQKRMARGFFLRWRWTNHCSRCCLPNRHPLLLPASVATSAAGAGNGGARVAFRSGEEMLRWERIEAQLTRVRNELMMPVAER
jgi:hypothetical protein